MPLRRKAKLVADAKATLAALVNTPVASRGPGRSVPPLAVRLPIVPLPPSASPLRLTSLPAFEPFTSSSPACTIVGPLYVFAAVKRRVPGPALVSPTPVLPLITAPTTICTVPAPAAMVNTRVVAPSDRLPVIDAGLPAAASPALTSPPRIRLVPSRLPPVAMLKPPPKN